MYKAISNMKKQVKGKKRKAVAKKDALLDEWTDMAVPGRHVASWCRRRSTHLDTP